MGGRCGGGGKEGGRDLGGGKEDGKDFGVGSDWLGGQGGLLPSPPQLQSPPLKGAAAAAVAAHPTPRGSHLPSPAPTQAVDRSTWLSAASRSPAFAPCPPILTLLPPFSPPSLNSSLLPLPPPLTRTTLTWCTASLAFASAPNPAAERSFPWPTTSAATCSSTPVRPSLFLCPPIPLFFSPQTFSPPQASGNSAARAAADPSSVKTTWRCTGGRTRGRRRFSKRERGGGCGFPPPSPL